LICSILPVVAISNGNPLASFEHVIAQQNATDNLEQDSSPIPTMIDNVRASVVGIILPNTLEENLGTNYEYDGSGFVYDVEDDIVYVITNEHVISDLSENETVDVHFIDNGALFEANVTGADSVADIAVLEVTLDSNQTTSSSPIEPLTLANSSDIHQGQQVFAIGSPFPTDASIPNLVTSGIISKSSYTYEDEEGGIIGAIVSDVPIVGGNSGGPLLNADGAVIGMIASGDEDDVQCCSYAIPSNTLKQIVPVLIENGEYSRPSIGFTPQTLAMDESTMPAEQKGIAIHSIERGGPADEAGLVGSTINQFGELQIGDIITVVDGKPIATAEEFEAYIVQNKVTGEDVDLTVSRNGTIDNTTITLE
jgi:S1-C subfamily serine protease